MRERPYAAKSCILAVILMCACLVNMSFANSNVPVQEGDKVDTGLPQESKSGDTHWALIAVSAVTLAAGTTLAVVYNNKAKDEGEKKPASREEFNNRHGHIGACQKIRTAGIGIAIVGGIGLGLSIAF